MKFNWSFNQFLSDFFFGPTIILRFTMRETLDSIDTQNRKQSLDDINLDQFLKIANYEDTVKELDVYYGIGKCALSTSCWIHKFEYIRMWLPSELI